MRSVSGTSDWFETAATGAASVLFVSQAVLALLAVKKIRNQRGAGRTARVGWLVFLSWLTLMAGTVLFCSALMRIPDHICELREHRGETCELV